MSSRRKRNRLSQPDSTPPLRTSGESPLAAHYRHSTDRRKTLQLCRQIERALSFALSEAPDVELRDLMIVSVEPAPNARRLLVTASVLDAEADPLHATTRLQASVGWLRQEIASSIHRRKVPELIVRCLPHETLLYQAP